MCVCVGKTAKSQLMSAMEKEKDKSESDRRMLVGVLWNCAAELKLLLTSLFLLCTLATLLQFLPPRLLSFSSSSSDLRSCIFRISPPPSSPPPPSLEQVIEPGLIRRSFNPYGWAAYNFITMGAYRGALNTFAIIGLSSKTLHLHSQPSYHCQWIPSNSNSTPILSQNSYKVLPDWGYGRIYTVVVVNCTFSQPINADNTGGKLLLHASTSGGGDLSLNLTDTIEALEEFPGNVDFSVFSAEPKYEYLYCGSSLYGNLSPQRVREWMAYHVRLFGGKSHFVFHDAGGVHPEVLEVLRPWMELGYVTIHDIRDQERFDGYYHNQFMVVNDCLHRYKFATRWMFFFDVDEFIYVPPKSTLRSVMHSLLPYTQFTIEQVPMSGQLCFSNDPGTTYRKWGFEKLVYRDVKKVMRRDRKYAVQPRSVYATGVHMSQNLDGRTMHKVELIKYFHYHGTIAQHREPCRTLTNSSELTLDSNPYVLDNRMQDAAGAVKRFELKTIGDRLQRTRQ